MPGSFRIPLVGVCNDAEHYTDSFLLWILPARRGEQTGNREEIYRPGEPAKTQTPRESGSEQARLGTSKFGPRPVLKRRVEFERRNSTMKSRAVYYKHAMVFCHARASRDRPTRRKPLRHDVIYTAHTSPLSPVATRTIYTHYPPSGTCDTAVSLRVSRLWRCHVAL